MIIGLGLTLRATLFGSTAVSDPYEVAGFSPSLVFDFAEEFYRTGGSTTTFDAAMTHSRSGNATMVDSDGVLMWAPHNLLLRSEEFNLSPWVLGAQGTGVTPTLTPNYALAPDGTMTAYRLQCSRSSSANADRSRIQQEPVSYGPIGSQMTNGIWIKSTDGTPQDIQVSDSTENNSVSTVTVGAEWQLVGREYAILLTAVGNFWVGLLGSGTTALTADVLIWGAHIYRSDLGGMVDNPDTGNSYVPTTSAARYLPRRGHHIYNGTSWVNEGVLVESETPDRVQLLHTTNALVTQSHTVTAVPHTLHFTGTGTITLSGASTAGPLVGTGTGENSRVYLTFTPTAASLTLTVSGTVTNAQLEVGSTPSSYIPNLAASGTVTRAADTITVPYANLPYDATAMSIQMDGTVTGNSYTPTRWYLDANNAILQDIGSTDFTFTQEAAGVVDTVTGGSFTSGINTPFNIASRHGSTFINGAVSGTALTADTTPTALPALSAANLQLGYDYMGTIKKFRMWSDDLGDEGLEEASA